MPHLLKPKCLEPVLCDKRSHCQQWRNGHREQTDGHGDGEEGEGEMNGESSVETCNTIRNTGEQKQGLGDNLEGWDGEGGEHWCPCG